MYILIYAYIYTYMYICVYMCTHTHTHRNLYAGQEATVRTGHGTKLVPNRERSMPRLILSPCLFNLYAEHIMRNAGPDEAQVCIKIARRKINNFRYTDGRKRRLTKKPLDERERGE